MGPKGKKNPKNAFSFFLDEYVQEQKKNGRQISHRIAAEECGVRWNELSQAEKERYSKMAGAYKESMKSNPSSKFTAAGESYVAMQRRIEEKQAKLYKADKEIEETITKLDINMLPLHLFYIVHCNYYCKTDSGLYVPGEIALSEFNLKDGIRKTLHHLIDPGEIPLGFAYEAQQNIKEVHGLPYPPYPQGNTNFSSIYKEIINFLKPGRMPDGRLPPLYALENNISACENILENLDESEDEMSFRVFLLHKMFFTLKNKCSENSTSENTSVGFPVLSNAIMEIEKDVFCYVPGISCSFHTDTEDNYQNCSLSVVKRFVYVICDHCCEILNIAIIPGKHGRMKCDLNRIKTVDKILEDADKRERDSLKTREPKSEASSISSFYGGSKAPEWIKITSSSLYDDLESVCSEASTTSSVVPSYGRGRGRGRGLLGLPDTDDEDVEGPGVSTKSLSDDFPPLGKGRGRF